jgi:hypothetical protein
VPGQLITTVISYSSTAMVQAKELILIDSDGTGKGVVVIMLSLLLHFLHLMSKYFSAPPATPDRS